jgi:hypothetical protein
MSTAVSDQRLPSDDHTKEVNMKNTTEIKASMSDTVAYLKNVLMAWYHPPKFI